MQYKSLLWAAAPITAAIIPRDSNTFEVTNFAVNGDWPNSMTTYNLDVVLGSYSGSCSAVNSIYGSNPCGGQPNAPAELAGPFDSTVCGKSLFSWSMNETLSETQPSRYGLSLQIKYDDGKTDPLYSCRFFPLDYTCSYDGNDPAAPGYSTHLVAPTSFSMTGTTNSECIYG